MPGGAAHSFPEKTDANTMARPFGKEAAKEN